MNMNKELLQKHVLELLLAENNITPSYQQEMDAFLDGLKNDFKYSNRHDGYNKANLSKLINSINSIKKACDERIESILYAIESDDIHVNHRAVIESSFSIEYYFNEFKKDFDKLKTKHDNDYTVIDYIESKHAKETGLIRQSHMIASKYCHEFPVLEGDKISILNCESEYIVSTLTIDSASTNKKYKLYVKPILKTKVSTKSDVFEFSDFSQITSHEKQNQYWKYIDAAFKKERISI